MLLLLLLLLWDWYTRIAGSDNGLHAHLGRSSQWQGGAPVDVLVILSYQHLRWHHVCMFNSHVRLPCPAHYCSAASAAQALPAKQQQVSLLLLHC
jgi:hypothetical protein